MRQWIAFAQAVDELDRMESRLAEMQEASVADFRQLGKIDQIEAVQDELDGYADDLAEFYGFDDSPAVVEVEQRRPASQIEDGEWLAW